MAQVVDTLMSHGKDNAMNRSISTVAAIQDILEWDSILEGCLPTAAVQQQQDNNNNSY